MHNGVTNKKPLSNFGLGSAVDLAGRLTLTPKGMSLSFVNKSKTLETYVTSSIMES